jgi:hypothetical protein
MNIEKLPDNVKVHPSVWKIIREVAVLDEGKAGKLMQRIFGLGIDPLPVSGECKSETISNLRKKGVLVKRLKCLDILEYRIFYAYKKSGLVCVYCVVPRDKDTYDENSWHYQMVKLLYAKWKECQ